MRILPLWVVACVFASALAPAQSFLHLQTRVIDPARETSEISGQIRTADASRQRYLIQMPDPPYEEALKQLQDRGARILGAVPDHGFIVSTPASFDWEGLELRYRAPVQPADKLSLALREPGTEEKTAAIQASGSRWVLVLFHEDVEPLEARRIVMDPNTSESPEAPPLEIREHANLLAHHLLVSGPAERIAALANWDEVALILPASEDLMRGEPVAACEGAVLNGFHLSPLAGANSTGGWPRNAQGEAEIGIHFGALTQKLSSAATLAEIRRALADWARVARLRFTENAAPSAPRAFSFLFATGNHGDPFPFTGARGVIAHAFFPAPPNPEPLAGDVHFNDDMAFRIGADIDLYSVALHEIGHALGLPHTDSPNAVMYPYYRMSSGLTAADIASIRQLYLAPSGPAPTPASLTLNVNPPPARSSAATLILEGTVANASGAARVDWANNQGGNGTATVASGGAWRATAIPLATGENQIRLTATDATQARAERTVNVTRLATAPPSTPTTPPVLAITEPAESRTTALSIRIRGTASHASGIRRILWAGNGAQGEAALATGTWTIEAVALRPGANTITVTATSNDGASASASLTIQAEANSDTTPPQVVIQTPGSTSVSTTLAQITLTGTASDAGGIAEMSWSSSAGLSGTVTGITPTYAQWRAEVQLITGFNTITIRARDRAGNVGWRTLSVTRR